ncbi:MAG: phage head closure protein [Betaproteobacteria bacterium]|nr:phage head closure protein [Betaproteobacteria bacterium]
MNIGRMDRRITIEQPSEAQDAAYGTTVTWTVLAVVAASWEALRGQERIVADSMQSTIEGKFRIRWRSDVTPAMRIRHDGRTYNIRGVIPLGRQDALELMVEAVGV